MQRSDRKRKVEFVKYEAKVASGLRSVYGSRRVVNLFQLPF